MLWVSSGYIIPGANIETEGAVPAEPVGSVHGTHLLLQATVDKLSTILWLRSLYKTYQMGSF